MPRLQHPSNCKQKAGAALALLLRREIMVEPAVTKCSPLVAGRA